MSNYALFLSVFSAFFGVPIYWTIVAIFHFTPQLKGQITSAMYAFPIEKLIIIGVLDGVQSVLSFISDSKVNGAMQQLLIQLVIPITMCLSLMLGTRYSFGQYVAAVLILGACVLDVVPVFHEDHGQGGDGSASDTIYWILIYVASVVPFAVSSVYKEVIFRDFNLHLTYLMASDSSFQLLTVLLLAPINAIPWLGTVSTFEDVYINIWQGVKCALGYPSHITDTCDGVWILLLEYMFFNVAINLLLLELLRCGCSSERFPGPSLV